METFQLVMFVVTAVVCGGAWFALQKAKRKGPRG